jgi:hypothetical protein
MRKAIAVSVWISAVMFSLGTWAAAPDVSDVSCTKTARRMVSIATLTNEMNLTLPLFERDPFLKCSRINWGDYSFIAIEYNGKDKVSFTGKIQNVRMYEIFEVVKSAKGESAEFKISDPIEDLKVVWSETPEGYLMESPTRLLENGNTRIVGARIFDVKRAAFIDRLVFIDKLKK